MTKKSWPLLGVALGILIVGPSIAFGQFDYPYRITRIDDNICFSSCVGRARIVAATPEIYESDQGTGETSASSDILPVIAIGNDGMGGGAMVEVDLSGTMTCTTPQNATVWGTQLEGTFDAYAEATDYSDYLYPLVIDSSIVCFAATEFEVGQPMQPGTGTPHINGTYLFVASGSDLNGGATSVYMRGTCGSSMVTAQGSAGTFYVSGTIYVNTQPQNVAFYSMGGLNSTLTTEELTAIGNEFPVGVYNTTAPDVTFPYFSGFRGTQWEGSCTTTVVVTGGWG